MRNRIQFVHTNLIARDWKKLARFYADVFGCEPVYPERDLSGDWIDGMTGIQDVKIRGVHLRLPGYENGPTLEIFSYSRILEKSVSPAINEPGFSHIAFHTDNVETLLSRLIEAGGETYGDVIETEITGAGFLKAVYAKDPEGNIIEIQNWKKI